MWRGWALVIVMGCGDGAHTCEEFCGLAARCDLPSSADGCVELCEADLRGASDFARACGRALEDRYQCVNTLTCDGLQDWLTEEPPDAFPCVEAELDTDLACGG